MASGSHVCSKNCALLPMAPMKSRKQITSRARRCIPNQSTIRDWIGVPWMTSFCVTAAKTCVKSSVPKMVKMPAIPRMKPKSPTRLTTKALIAAALGGRPVVPEADEQVRREADALPTEEHLDEIVGGHQREHREGEKREIREEARAVRILVHIADGIDVHEARDDGDDDEHHARQAVDPKGPSHIKAAGLDEGVELQRCRVAARTQHPPTRRSKGPPKPGGALLSAARFRARR